MSLKGSLGKCEEPHHDSKIYIKDSFIFSLFRDIFNLFYATGLSLNPLETSENQRFFDIFKEYRKRPLG